MIMHVHKCARDMRFSSFLTHVLPSQVIKNEAITKHLDQVIIKITDSCKKFADSISKALHDFSPKGRHEVKDCLYKLGQARELQHLIGNGYQIRKEYSRCKVEIKNIEASEQQREYKDLENVFVKAMVSFRDALKELVSHVAK
jgi:hypothetical protein